MAPNWSDGVEDSDVRDKMTGFGTRDKVGDLGTGRVVSVRSSVAPSTVVVGMVASGILALLKRGQSDAARTMYR